MATPDPAPLPQSMPDDLRDRGWRMSRINEGQYRAKNDRLGLYSVGVSTPEDAIEAARQLDAGKQMLVVGNTVVFKDESGSVELHLGSRAGDVIPTDTDPDESDPAQTSKTQTSEGTDQLEIPEQVERPLSTNTLVAVEKVRLDGGTQPREEIDQTTVDRYAEDYQNGAVFPPIVLFHDGIFYWLADGFHRFFAFRKAFPESAFITGDVRAGTQRDAVLFSLAANATHGLPRSNADKRRAALTLLQDPEWSKWSDNFIAQKALVSQPFVSSLRRELSQNVLSDGLAVEERVDAAQSVDRADLSPSPLGQPGQIATATSPQPAQPTKRIGADGVARDTSQIGRKAERQDTEAVKVIDKRRVTADGGSAKTPLESLLKGRKLALSFVWIPGVAGKVHVSVNASNKPADASRKLIPAEAVPRFPEEILSLITDHLAGHQTVQRSKEKLKPKPQRSPVLRKKKPVTKKKVFRSASPNKTKKTARKK